MNIFILYKALVCEFFWNTMHLWGAGEVLFILVLRGLKPGLLLCR